MSNIFSIENLYYQIDKMQIIKNINCVIKNGITIINGPNGAGKTTFLKTSVRFDKPDKKDQLLKIMMKQKYALHLSFKIQYF